MSLEGHSAVGGATLERLEVDTARVMLEATALLLRQESVSDLLRVGLQRIAQMMQADAAMLHLESDSARVFTLREACNLEPVPVEHLIHDNDPQGSLPLLSAGHWMIWDYPIDWHGRPEQRYDRISGVRQAATFGLRDGNRLLGYVTLLFHAPRAFDAHSQALGGLGAIWGLQLHRLTQLADKERAHQRLALLDRVRLMVSQQSDSTTMIGSSSVSVAVWSGCRTARIAAFDPPKLCPTMRLASTRPVKKAARASTEERMAKVRANTKALG